MKAIKNPNPGKSRESAFAGSRNRVASRRRASGAEGLSQLAGLTASELTLPPKFATYTPTKFCNLHSHQFLQLTLRFWKTEGVGLRSRQLKAVRT